MQGIYKIVNKLTGMYYVGSSIDVERRLKEHRASLDSGLHGNSHLQNSWNKYGAVNFEFVPIKEIPITEDLIKYEQEYLDDGFSDGRLYNILEKADCSGTRSEETRQLMSKAHKGKSHPEEVRAKIGRKGEKNGMYGKAAWNRGKKTGPVSMEIRQKQSDAHKGHVPSIETRAKLSQMRKGRKIAPCPEERKQRISKSLKGNIPWNKGKKLTENHCLNLSLAHKGKQSHVREYPAYYNSYTGQYISEGVNLKKICLDYNLNYECMRLVRIGQTKQTRNGWRLASEEEIKIHAAR